MTDHELRMEERIAWACAVGLLVLVLATMIWNRREVEAVQQAAAVDPALLARVAALEARAAEQAKIRCLNVTTDRMDMAIFPVDNVGKKKVEGR